MSEASPPDDAAHATPVTRVVRPRPRPEGQTGTGLRGLALSGGGIRSATFCFGLLKALAGKRLLGGFQFVSTVSGGGYIGATLGRLFQQFGPAKTQDALADADKRWFAHWLRANGRYLIPHGARDASFALASYLRNLLGIHLELAFVGLVLGALLVGFDFVCWGLLEGRGDTHGALFRDFVSTATQWPTPWLLLIPELFVLAVLACAYWCVPDGAFRRIEGFRWATAGIALVLALALAWHEMGGPTPYPLPPPDAASLVLLAVAAMLLASALGTVVAHVAGERSRRSMPLDGVAPGEHLRNRLTRWLSVGLRWTALTIGLGLVDLAAWRIAQSPTSPAAAGASVAVGIAVLRAVLPLVGDLPRGLPPLARISLLELLNLFGLALLAMLLVFWISIVHRVTSQALFPSVVLDWAAAWTWLATLGLPPALFMLVSGRNRDFLNRSSLFSFYRSRLVRSYLGAVNPGRFTMASGPVVSPIDVPALGKDEVHAVSEVIAGDDVAIADYRSDAQGGPEHLINVCVNQTLDEGKGLFNRDRKGCCMTIGAGGRVRVGLDGWASARQVDMTLGAWTAISGAAVASGLGASTRPGVSSLLVLAGLRLGYWWDSAVAFDDTLPRKGKYGQLMAELRGAFAGRAQRDWYLSDGGHFENTAAYALLREECELVVIADCGADPRYAYGDLENLVRKARIDLQAEIAFLRPEVEVALLPDGRSLPLSAFGSLNDLASPDSDTCLALARVSYRRSGRVGHLVVVKPNMCGEASVDLVNFKAENRLFPQESTTDQFFSEAQWESYFQLGQVIGRKLEPAFLDHVGDIAWSCFRDDEGSVAAKVVHPGREMVTAKRVPSRIAATGAVTASLSLGALATVLSTGWQTLQDQLQLLGRARDVDTQVVKELSDAFGDLAPPAAGASAAFQPSALSRLATKLARINMQECPDGNRAAFQNNELIRSIARDTIAACLSSDPAPPACGRIAGLALQACLVKSDGPVCNRMYWVRSYDPADYNFNNCRNTGAVASRDYADYLNSALPGLGDWLVHRNGGQIDMASIGGPVTAPAASAASAAVDPGGSGRPSWTTARNDIPTAWPSPNGGGRGLASVPDEHGDPGDGTAPPTAPQRAPLPACANVPVLIKTFGADDRRGALQLRDSLVDRIPNLPPVEDAWETAQRMRRVAPQAPEKTLVLYPEASLRSCAVALAKEAKGEATPLPRGITASPGVIEIWIASQNAVRGTDGSALDLQALVGYRIEIFFGEKEEAIAKEIGRRLLVEKYGLAGQVKVTKKGAEFFAKYSAGSGPTIRYESRDEGPAANAVKAILARESGDAAFDAIVGNIPTTTVQNRTAYYLSIFVPPGVSAR